MERKTLREIADARWAEFLEILRTRKLFRRDRQVIVEEDFSSQIVPEFDTLVLTMTKKLFSEDDFRYVAVRLESSAGKRHRYLLDVSRRGFVSKGDFGKGNDKLDLSEVKGYDNLHTFRKELYSVMAEAVTGSDRRLGKQRTKRATAKKPVELTVVDRKKVAEA